MTYVIVELIVSLRFIKIITGTLNSYLSSQVPKIHDVGVPPNDIQNNLLEQGSLRMHCDRHVCSSERVYGTVTPDERRVLRAPYCRVRKSLINIATVAEPGAPSGAVNLMVSP